jgi:hypothetical protein
VGNLEEPPSFLSSFRASHIIGNTFSDRSEEFEQIVLRMDHKNI